MSTSPKLYILPFQKDSNEKVESAAVFALAERERSKGSGLIVKQPEEKLLFLSKVGYPLWLFPKNHRTLIFDGVNNSSYSIIYTEIPSAKQLLQRLESSVRPLENYLTFLSSYVDYFQKPLPQRQFTLNGLIGDLDFQNDFTVYNKEAGEVTHETTSKFFLLKPSLDERAIANILAASDSLQSTLKEEADNLSECIKQIKKTTNIHKTEIEYQSEAAKEEINAKIKAQTEIVNPQIAETNKQHNQKIKQTTRSFNNEIQSLQKLRSKTIKIINKTQTKIKVYEQEAKAQENKEHLIYARRWRNKIKQADSELTDLKRKLKNLENNIEQLNKQKVQEIYLLKSDLESEIERAWQPIRDLEAERSAKMTYYRQQNLKMIDLETPVVDGLIKNLGSWDSTKDKFENLGAEGELDSPVLFYMPFYLACFIVNNNKRYLIVPPSTVGYEGFSSKLKGALGISKIKNLLNPRFKSIALFMRKIQELIQQDAQLENQLYVLGEENNLLKNSVFQENVREGLIYLKQEGWLSSKEHQAVNDQR